MVYRELGVAVIAITKVFWPSVKSGQLNVFIAELIVAVMHTQLSFTGDLVGSPKDPRYRDRLPVLACC